MKAILTLAAIALLVSPKARAADEVLHYFLYFGIENEADFCKGFPEDFETSCSSVQLGDDLEVAKQKFSEYCHSGFKNLLQNTTCTCELISEDSNGKGGPKHPHRKAPPFNMKATPKIKLADLGFTSGPPNGGGMMIFKDGKPDAWSDGGNIDCSNVDQYLAK